MNFKRKTVLARLIANENLTIKMMNVDTAHFEVQNRVLVLPYWQSENNDMTDLLIGHEVSHALYTPYDDKVFDSADFPFSYFNVTEDVRIEKLILRKYPGLYANFKRGYRAMFDEGFFGIKESQIASCEFMDRLNIFAKMRGQVKVPFTKDEMVWVKKSLETETFDDVFTLTKEIAKWLKTKKQKTRKEKIADKMREIEDMTQEEFELSKELEKFLKFLKADKVVNNETTYDVYEKDEYLAELEKLKKEKAEEFGGEETDDEDEELPEIITDAVVERGMSKLSAKTGKFVLGTNKEVVDECVIPYEVVYSKIRTDAEKIIITEEEDIAELKSAIKADVIPMVKQFEMKKSAYVSMRARTARSGAIDVDKLYKYQLEDDLFRQVTKVPNFKNHGVVMMVDFSGSMANVMGRVIQQVLTLTAFFKKIGVPFEIYGFTNAMQGYEPDLKKVYGENETSVNMSNMMLFEILSSRMNKDQYDNAQTHLLKRAVGCRSEVSEFLYHMSSTPLTEALMVIKTKIDQFHQRYKCEKTIFVALTDGGGASLNYFNGMAHAYTPKYGKRVEVDGDIIDLNRTSSGAQTQKVLDLIRSKGVKTINFHIIPDRSVKSTIQLVSQSKLRKKDANFHIKSIEKTGTAYFDDLDGYDRRIFMTDENVRQKNDRLVLSEKTQVKTIADNMTRKNKKKNMGRTIAEKFCDIIA